MIMVIMQIILSLGLGLYSPFNSIAEVTEAIFNFYLSVFDCLLNQIGSSQAEKAVQTFLQTFNQHNIQTTLRQGNTHGVRAVER